MGVGTLTELFTDQALLERFVRHKDGEAFAALVRRHGPMVRATCVRHLGDTPDADDAFQAVFVVLVRRAAVIYRRELLGPWLHTVAVRAARKAIALRQRRQSRERTVTHMPEPTLNPAEPRDWLPMLDDAVQGLPEKYRVPLVLCELQGLSRAEAAGKLALAEGTLSSRLARGRELLRRRLLRRGVNVSAVALPAVLASQASASVAPGLIASTTQAALGGSIAAPVAAITHGVLSAMFIAKCKLVAVVLLGLSVFLTGAGLLAWQLSAQTPVAGNAGAKKDRDALQGTWTVVSAQVNGQAINPNEEAAIKGKPVVFKGDKLIARHEGDYKLDETKTPRELDMIPSEGPPGEKGQTFRCIYELKGDDLKLTFNGPNQPRPKAFDEEGAMALVLRRAKQ
jgi:RNA polymerase sigma factor (sigma-70 family)